MHLSASECVPKIRRAMNRQVRSKKGYSSHGGADSERSGRILFAEVCRRATIEVSIECLDYTRESGWISVDCDRAVVESVLPATREEDDVPPTEG